MTEVTSPTKTGPSLWAVGLLILSSSFAAAAIALVSMS